MNLAKNHMISIRTYKVIKDVELKDGKLMCKQVCQGISQTGMPQNRIIPIPGKASSLPAGWNLASSTTTIKLLTIQW